ncbi:MAG: hypothetical protein ACLP29_05000 [Dissulfurispiraceae bacterium]
MKRILISIVVSLFIGYLFGAREGLSDLASVILELTVIGIGLGLAGILGYYCYVSFAMTRLQERKHEIDKAFDTLQQEKAKFYNVERPEHAKNLGRLMEEYNLQRLKHALISLEIQIKGELEVKYQRKYQMELQLIKGMHPQQIQGRKIIKKTLSGSPILYRASNGVQYARLREGPQIS